MKFTLEAKGLEVDDWILDYVRTTVVFAIWHHAQRFAAVRVELADATEATDATRGDRVCCRVRVELDGGGVVTSDAKEVDLFSAVQEASNLLEAALHRPPCPAPGGVPARRERLAA